jgi:Spy/CpxP family protein refolding chaperone
MRRITVVALLLAATSVARAQTQISLPPGCGQNPNEPIYVVDGKVIDCGPGGPRPPAGDPLARYLFPPEMIMANQRAINLTDAQRNSLQQAMADAQGKFIGLQFKMSSEVEKLQSLLQPATVDESRVLEQVDRVLAVERDVKRAQLSLMIRIKNMLTQQQQAQLATLRRQGPGE